MEKEHLEEEEYYSRTQKNTSPRLKVKTVRGSVRMQLTAALSWPFHWLDFSITFSAPEGQGILYNPLYPFHVWCTSLHCSYCLVFLTLLCNIIICIFTYLPRSYTSLPPRLPEIGMRWGLSVFAFSKTPSIVPGTQWVLNKYFLICHLLIWLQRTTRIFVCNCVLWHKTYICLPYTVQSIFGNFH